jgi:hypothetical protein
VLALTAVEYSAFAVVMAFVWVESEVLTPEELSLLLSVLVTPFALTVTEQVIRAPAADAGMFQELEVVLAVTASEVCVMPLISRL